jgi:O-antigen/teichoic acid export membrane protein
LINKILKSSLFKASGLYTLFSIINLAVPFILLPILTRYLSPEDYGIITMFSLLVSIINLFVGLNLHGAINRAYFEKNIDFKEYIANCMYLFLFSTLIVFIIMYLLKDRIFLITGVPQKWIIIGVIYSFFQFAILVNLIIYQARLEVKKYGLLQLSQAFLNLFFTILFVVILTMKWEGRLLAQCLAALIIGIISLIIIIKFWTKWKINVAYMIHAIKFSLPLIPNTMGGMLMVMTDRFIINNVLGLREVGIYTAGLQVGMIIEILASSFNKAWTPWLFNKLNENNLEIKIKIVKFTYLYFIGMIILALFLGLLSPLVVKIVFGKDFYAAKEVIIWIALGCAFHGMYYMVTNYIFYTYKTHILMWVTLFCGILNFYITYYFVHMKGIVGASISYMIVSFLLFILTWIISIKVYKMPWKLKNV